GGGEHDHRRAHRARSDPAPQSGTRAGHRRIPAQQDCDLTMRIIEAADEAAVARILDRSAARNPEVERTAAAIVADVRARGDAAVREDARTVHGPDSAAD